MKLLPAVLLAALAAASLLRADVKLGSPFTSHMVLQRDVPVPVWGWADPGESVTIDFAGQKKTAVAAADGKWRVTLDPLAASATPRDLLISSANPKSEIQNPKLEDVLVGEVWLASGQSNMDFSVSKKVKSFAGVINEAEEIAAANYPLIRMFVGEPVRAYEPRDTVPGTWKVCSPETVGAFSAVGYFFARDLQKELNVPVGVVVLSFGASCAHAWIRRDVMLDDPAFKAVLDKFDADVKAFIPPTPAQIAEWEELAAKAKAAGTRAPRRPGGSPVQDQHNPTVLYNGMVHAFVGFPVKGFLWYQGESITAPRDLFPRWNEALIRDWRALWGAELPFYFVQLAALQANSNSPQVRAWQAEALKLPKTGMVVTIDVGDRKDVHPHNKAPVGHRLARLALANDYGRKLTASGPVFASAALDGSAVRLRFTELDSGLVASGNATGDPSLKTFELAGADGKFVAADAKIDGDTVVVSAADVPAPASVRYAWANYPEGANLANTAGLPAAPFSAKLATASISAAPAPASAP